MADNVLRYGDYPGAGDSPVIRTCLHVATLLGDHIATNITIVGGLVPSLLIPAEMLPVGGEAHCGTMDVDLGLSLAVLDTQVYAEIAERLREAGFAAVQKDDGKIRRQTWRAPADTVETTVDFLIPPVNATDEAGGSFSLEEDFAAFITPGLQLVAQDWQAVMINGRTLHDEAVTRAVRVCGPAAYCVLKARALHIRGKEKDAYDMFYLLQNYPGGLEAIAEALRPLLADEDAQEAMKWLEDDYASHDSIGPRRTALFRLGMPDDNIEADAMGLVQDLLRRVT